MNEYIKRLRECLRDGSNDPQSPEHWRVWLGKILSDMEKAKAMAEAGLVEYASWLEGHINTCDAGDSDGRAMLKMCLHKFTTKILSHHPTPEPTDKGEDKKQTVEGIWEHNPHGGCSEFLGLKTTPAKAEELRIGFSDRLHLEAAFREWAKECGAMECPLSVVTWLQSKGMLNANMARAYLNGLPDKEGI